MKHLHFIVHRLRSIIIICYFFFFLDVSLPLSELIFPNPHENFKFEGRNIIFEKKDYLRSLVLKKGISNGILEVFAFLIITIILFVI
jgi:hypothetical protein